MFELLINDDFLHGDFLHGGFLHSVLFLRTCSHHIRFKLMHIRDFWNISSPLTDSKFWIFSQ